MPSSSQCMVCDGDARPFISKDFNGLFDLGRVDYWRCDVCGFVYSKTHFEMSSSRWSDLNERYHRSYQGTSQNVDDPKWKFRLAAQRGVIAQLNAAKALPAARPWLDWGAGDGDLSSLLKENGLSLLNYDRYMSGEGFLLEGDLRPEFFDFVITTSVFEHVTDRAVLDHISGLVSSSGVLGLHTLVRETIPRDPGWFYFLPVHVAFYTNRSMELLFQRWGYASSLYHVPSRLWFFFRNPGIDVDNLAEARNTLAGAPEFFAKKDSFADYWRT